MYSEQFFEKLPISKEQWKCIKFRFYSDMRKEDDCKAERRSPA